MGKEGSGWAGKVASGWVGKVVGGWGRHKWEQEGRGKGKGGKQIKYQCTYFSDRSGGAKFSWGYARKYTTDRLG